MTNFHLQKLKSSMSQDEEAFSFRKTGLKEKKYEPYVKKYEELYSQR